MVTNDLVVEPSDSNVINWGADSPRGGKAVLSRILKEGATVPLFFAQTLVDSLRDVGYNHTTSALCEHIDNAIEAGATEVRLFFRQIGKQGSQRTDIAVYDNGRGMSPNVLKVAMAFGGSMNYNNRNGIGRFGMGMKTAALSMSPVLEVYSWQERAAFYNMTLDVEEIGKERANLVQLPDAALLTELPDEVADFFYKTMGWPSEADEQDLFASNKAELAERLGASGTIVYMPNCDRLTYAKVKNLGTHAVQEVARVYRRYIAEGLKLFINNRPVEASDPTYSIAGARHTRLPDLPVTHSQLVLSKQIEVRIRENAPETVPITIKLYKLPIEAWYSLSLKVLKNDLRVFDGLTVSILRNGREVYAGGMSKLTTRHSVTHWYRIQIDFPGVLDEAFGVSANKQGVRMKDHVFSAIKHAIGDDVTAINNEIRRYQAAQASARVAAKPSESEVRASDVDHLQAKPLDADLPPEEQAQMDANLRGLAVSLRREGETDDQAYERVKQSKYLIAFRHDQYWPFYHVEHKFGRVILTINSAHPFFTRLYDPIQKMSLMRAEAGEEGAEETPPDTRNTPVVALELLLLSLARTQSVLSANNDEAEKLLEAFRREWSETYRVQLSV
jgi:hypothetical protein